MVALTANPSSVQPGGTVVVTARNTAPGATMEIRLDSPTGRVLATNPPHTQSVMQSVVTVNVPIPADVPAGQHILVAVEDYHNHNSGIPARATVYVGQQPSAPPAAPARPAAVDTASGPSGGALAAVGLGVAAVALLLAGLWYLVASRKAPKAQPQAAR